LISSTIYWLAGLLEQSITGQNKSGINLSVLMRTKHETSIYPAFVHQQAKPEPREAGKAEARSLNRRRSAKEGGVKTVVVGSGKGGEAGMA